MTKPAAQVAILMGSDSNWEVMSAAARQLGEFGILYDVQVMSAYRTPARVAEYASSSPHR